MVELLRSEFCDGFSKKEKANGEQEKCKSKDKNDKRYSQTISKFAGNFRIFNKQIQFRGIYFYDKVEGCPFYPAENSGDSLFVYSFFSVRNLTSGNPIGGFLFETLRKHFPSQNPENPSFGRLSVNSQEAIYSRKFQKLGQAGQEEQRK